MKTFRKEFRTLPENIKMEVIYPGTKLRSQFNIKDPIPKKRIQDIIYHTVCPEDNSNEDCIDECSKRPEERNSIESAHNEVSESDFLIIGKVYSHHTRRRKIST